jgi:hypothetical protein
VDFRAVAWIRRWACGRFGVWACGRWRGFIYFAETSSCSLSPFRKAFFRSTPTRPYAHTPNVESTLRPEVHAANPPQIREICAICG